MTRKKEIDKAAANIINNAMNKGFETNAKTLLSKDFFFFRLKRDMMRIFDQYNSSLDYLRLFLSLYELRERERGAGSLSFFPLDATRVRKSAIHFPFFDCHHFLLSQ